jgi:hypothetical protein
MGFYYKFIKAQPYIVAPRLTTNVLSKTICGSAKRSHRFGVAQIVPEYEGSASRNSENYNARAQAKRVAGKTSFLMVHTKAAQAE